MVEPVRRTYRAPRNPVPWLELASADGPQRSGLHASTIILGSIVLTDAIGEKVGVVSLLCFLSLRLLRLDPSAFITTIRPFA